MRKIRAITAGHGDEQLRMEKFTAKRGDEGGF